MHSVNAVSFFTRGQKTTQLKLTLLCVKVITIIMWKLLQTCSTSVTGLNTLSPATPQSDLDEHIFAYKLFGKKKKIFLPTLSKSWNCDLLLEIKSRKRDAVNGCNQFSPLLPVLKMTQQELLSQAIQLLPLFWWNVLISYVLRLGFASSAFGWSELPGSWLQMQLLSPLPSHNLRAKRVKSLLSQVK